MRVKDALGLFEDNYVGRKLILHVLELLLHTEKSIGLDIFLYLEYDLSDALLDEIERLMKLENPRDAKLELATEIVKIYHGKDEAEKAKEYFVKTISNKEIPDDVQIFPSSAPQISILDYMVESGLATSKSDARRKIEQGGVSLNGERVASAELMLDSESFMGKGIPPANFVAVR